MVIEYVEILTGEFLSLKYVANKDNDQYGSPSSVEGMGSSHKGEGVYISQLGEIFYKGMSIFQFPHTIYQFYYD